MTVTNGLSAGPLPSNLTCPSGQTFVLACVSYSNITLTDTTNNVKAQNSAGGTYVVPGPRPTTM